jgi:hypothetical protein
MTNDDWTLEQLKPLSMFELAKWWADALKVIGAGNGAGILAAGAALSQFENHHNSVFLIKLAGAFFFIGVLAFAVAFAMLHQAMFAQDEVAHATHRKDADAIRANSALYHLLVSTELRAHSLQFLLLLRVNRRVSEVEFLNRFHNSCCYGEPGKPFVVSVLFAEPNREATK